ncbi:hypothetical protein EDB83DRAFT_2324510 [Lactarius deliciosus]|nr:hypothetical protein EDB83DRAFT_2324510 [Lactarius deliciosus]
MSQTPSSSSNLQAIFNDSIKEYRKKTKKDLLLHPLMGQLQTCNSPADILAVLRTQVQQFEESTSGDDKLTKWLNPTVNVLYAFSAVLGEGVGLITTKKNIISASIEGRNSPSSNFRMESLPLAMAELLLHRLKGSYNTTSLRTCFNAASGSADPRHTSPRSSWSSPLPNAIVVFVAGVTPTVWASSTSTSAAGEGGGVGLVMGSGRSSAACIVSVIVVAVVVAAAAITVTPRSSSLPPPSLLGVVPAVVNVVVILAVTIVVILVVVAVGVVLMPLLPVARLRTRPGPDHATGPVGDSASKILCSLSSAATPTRERQGKSLKNRDGFKFSVHTCPTGSVAWHSLRVYASRAGAGSRGTSSVGRNASAWEVVCSASMLCSAPEPMPGSSGCPAVVTVVPSSVVSWGSRVLAGSTLGLGGRKRRTVAYVVGHGAQTTRRVSWHRDGITKQRRERKVFSPTKVIFAGAGVLLLVDIIPDHAYSDCSDTERTQAAKDVAASQDALIDIFERIESFFRRLEEYSEVPTTEAMKDIIVKIMVEVLGIFGTVTKEMKQGRTRRSGGCRRQGRPGY